MADISVAQGDYGYYINFTVLDSASAAWDLTGYTITLKTWPNGNPSALTMSGACSIVAASTGTCRYAVVSTDFVAKGKYICELELSQAGVLESTKTYNLEVTESA